MRFHKTNWELRIKPEQNKKKHDTLEYLNN